MLFVCTANVARSPYAERRAAQLAGRPDGFASAGIPGKADWPMDEQMADQLLRRGGDPEGHESRVLTGEIVAAADVVLTFEFAQQMRVLDAWPEADAKTFGLHQFAAALDRVVPGPRGPHLVDAAYRVAGPNSMTWDVADPYRRGRRAAKACADEIDSVLAGLVARFTT